MNVSPDLIERAQQTQLSYDGYIFYVRVDSPDAPEAVLVAVGAALDAVSSPEAHWDTELRAGSVVIRHWGYVPDIGGALERLAAGLEKGGVHGSLVPGDPEPVLRSPRPPSDEALIECHVRFSGRRYRVLKHDQISAWQHPTDDQYRPQLVPDRDAILTGVEAGLQWLGDRPDGASLWSRFGRHRDVDELRAIVIRDIEEITRWLRDHRPRHAGSVENFAMTERLLQLRLHLRAWWQTENAFRCLYVDQTNLSVAEGGPDVAEGDAWRVPYEACLAFLRASAGWGAYGFIKPGRSVASVGYSLWRDWVADQDRGIHQLGHFIYEDVLAPDAFGAQLLGRGYAGRVPCGDDWGVEDLEDGARLVTHREPDQWFRTLTSPTRSDGAAAFHTGDVVPAVLARARADFAPLLITGSVLDAHPLEPVAR